MSADPVNIIRWKPLIDEKQPHAVARADGAPLALAGIWAGWKHPTRDGGILSFAILTTAANATLRQLHDRMPVVVEEPDWPVWLGEEGGNPAALLQPAAEHVLRFWPVSRMVNNVRNDGPDLLDRIDDPHAPPPSSAPAGPNPA